MLTWALDPAASDREGGGLGGPAEEEGEEEPVGTEAVGRELQSSAENKG